MYATGLIESTARQAVGGTALTRTPIRCRGAVRPSASPSSGRTWPLEHRPAAAADARRIARRVLTEWQGCASAQDSVLLIVSELVTNAVEHAEALVRLHLHRTAANGRMWVGVSDGGPAEHDGPWTGSCADDERGRGLRVVRMLAEEHSVRTGPGTRTTRWTRVGPAGV